MKSCNVKGSGSPATENTRSRSPDSLVLPPCQVCGDKSSGFHYGANTCEACKGFFRRTLKKKEVNFKCICKGNVKSRHHSQKSICPRCRYEKCVAIGMSKKAIKIGRYTLTRKTDNIRAVKRLEETDENRAVDRGNKCARSPMLGSPLASSSSTSGYSSDDPVSLSSPPSVIEPRSESPEKCCQIQTIPRDYDHVMQSLLAAQEKLLGSDFLQRLKGSKEIEENYSAQYKQHIEVFGDIGCLSMDEFLDFYNYTGIDLDNRLEMFKDLLEFLEEKIADMISFAKAIPGFTALPLQDQACLIKGSRLEQHLLTMHRAIDYDLNVMSVPWGKGIYHCEEMHKMYGKENFVQRMAMTKKFKDLRLTLSEEALVRAMIMTFSDRDDIERPDLVQDIQYHLLDCLQYTISHRPTPQRHLLAQIINALAMVRSLTHSDETTVNYRKQLFELPQHKEFSLTREFLT